MNSLGSFNQTVILVAVTDELNADRNERRHEHGQEGGRNQEQHRGPGRPVRSVNGLLTGLHDPLASHLAMLYAVAGQALPDGVVIGLVALLLAAAAMALERLRTVGLLAGGVFVATWGWGWPGAVATPTFRAAAPGGQHSQAGEHRERGRGRDGTDGDARSVQRPFAADRPQRAAVQGEMPMSVGPRACPDGQLCAAALEASKALTLNSWVPAG